MKKIRTFMLLSVAFATFAVMVSCSKNNDTKKPQEDDGRREVMSGKEDVEKISAPAISSTETSYLMRLENETLTLYEITGGTETPVTNIAIDPSYYPPEDIKELNRGILAYSKEEGFARLENFTN